MTVTRQEVIYGITSISADQASPEQVLSDNRRHWSVESSHYIIDWNYDEDLSQIRTDFGPENITRLRRFAIGLLKSKNGLQDPLSTLSPSCSRFLTAPPWTQDSIRVGGWVGG
ncbi:MAG: hypothetical protein KZQ89_01310 [Candidatus Thiodiazotropha sp. (ex Lucinoma kastoroae)]|nr:hypothetical protein [Candidatus Thiodiazotropha sp. (ex Lucinoma kastoroae)]